MCKQVQLVSLCHLSSSGGVGWMMTDVGVEAALRLRPSSMMVEDDMPALAAAVAAPIRRLWVLNRDGLKPSDLR